ncbi:hypothetical protein KJ865_13480, partial [Myxococcota bacterium]|nr:hypothetical protein [Myxococcota bacterium]
GRNVTGPLGDGTTGNSATPRLVDATPAGGYSQMAVGYSHVCLLDLNGLPWCFGDNTEGQLGDGTTVQKNIPTLVAAPQ